MSLEDNESHKSIRSIRFRLSRAVLLSAAVAIASVGLIFALIAFTPLRRTIPGYPDAHSKKIAVANAIKIDSLESAVSRWHLYAENLSRVLAGGKTLDFDSLVRSASVNYLSDKSREELEVRDSVLRETVRKEDRFSVGDKERSLPIEGMHFFTPVKGVVVRGFDQVRHPAIDISAPSGSVVSAVLDGTLIFSSLDEEDGYICIIQHKDNVISIYSNNRKILKNPGDDVSAGTPVALVGSSAGNAGHEHLHFELWHNGTPLDPTHYISF